MFCAWAQAEAWPDSRQTVTLTVQVSVIIRPGKHCAVILDTSMAEARDERRPAPRSGWQCGRQHSHICSIQPERPPTKKILCTTMTTYLLEKIRTPLARRGRREFYRGYETIGLRRRVLAVPMDHLPTQELSPKNVADFARILLTKSCSLCNVLQKVVLSVSQLVTCCSGWKCCIFPFSFH